MLGQRKSYFVIFEIALTPTLEITKSNLSYVENVQDKSYLLLWK